MTRPRRASDNASPANSLDASTTTIIEVGADLVGQRLDRALAISVSGLSRTRAQTAIVEGHVAVNGSPARSSLVLETGMRIAYTPAPPSVTAPLVPQAATPGRSLRIVYEDPHLLVVDKPAGIVVHPAPGHPTDTLVDALRAHAPGLHGGDDPTRPGIVHRLDKDTSGLLVVAKDAASHTTLAQQMKARTMVKRYLALVEGQMPIPEGVIEAPMGRDPRHRQRMALVSTGAGGREARTRFRVVRTGRGRSLLELQLETGRTHQIRVHLAAINHPVVGDRVYGSCRPPLPPRQFLHAAHLELAHPVTGDWLSFDAPLPDDLTAFLAEWDPQALP